MISQARVLARLVWITGATLALLALHDQMVGRQGHTGYVYCMRTMGLVAVSCMFVYGPLKTVQALMAPRAPHHLYLRQPDAGQPRLNMQSIWLLVYGVGFVYFVTGQAVLGLSPVLNVFLCASLSGLCLDELVYPRQPLGRLYLQVRLAIVVMGLAGQILICTSVLTDIWDEINASVSGALFNMVAPFASQLIMFHVRDHRRHGLGSVLETCEFGLPFAVIMGVVVLGSIEGQRQDMDRAYEQLYNTTLELYHNRTMQQGLVGPMVFYSLAPFLLIPSIVVYTECVLDGAAIDAYLGLGLGLSVSYTARMQASTVSVYALVCLSAACAVRVLGDYRMQLPDAVSLQEESSQIPDRALREKDEEEALV